MSDKTPEEQELIDFVTKWPISASMQLEPSRKFMSTIALLSAKVQRSRALNWGLVAQLSLAYRGTTQGMKVGESAERRAAWRVLKCNFIKEHGEELVRDSLSRCGAYELLESEAQKPAAE